MRVVAKVDAGGLYVEDVILEDDESLPAECVEARPPDGFHHPRWDGSAWTEGKPAVEVLEAKKPVKVSEMHTRAIEELKPLFTENAGKDELIFLLAAHVAQICQVLLITPDPRLAEVERVGTKALEKKAQVDAATTEAELEGISWDAP